MEPRAEKRGIGLDLLCESIPFASSACFDLSLTTLVPPIASAIRASSILEIREYVAISSVDERGGSTRGLALELLLYTGRAQLLAPHHTP